MLSSINIKVLSEHFLGTNITMFNTRILNQVVYLNVILIHPNKICQLLKLDKSCWSINKGLSLQLQFNERNCRVRNIFSIQLSHQVNLHLE